MTRIAACAVWLCLGCSSETRVDVFFEADPALAGAASSIEVRVVDTEGDTVLDTVEPLAERGLPVAIRLEPADGDATRSFLVVAHLRDAGGDRIARVAAGGGYVAGEARQLRLRFAAGCAAGLDCAGATTCVMDACVDACVAGTSACGPRDGGAPGEDAGVEPPDGGDAGAGTDAGAHEPAYLQRTVATVTTDRAMSALSEPLTVDASGGPWVVLASAQVSSSPSIAGGGRARLLVDGAEVAIGGASSADGSGGPWGAFALLSSGASHTVDVEVLPSAGTNATVAELRIVAFPLPAAHDVQLEEALDNRLIAQSAGWVTMAELTFTPARGGRYLVLAGLSATPTPAGPVQVRLEDDSGGQWPVAEGTPPHLAGVAGDRETFLLMRAPMLGVGAPARFTLQLSAGNPNSMASHARVLAFALDGFADSRHDEVLGADATSSPEPVPVASVTAPAGPVRDWIALSAITLRADGLRGAALRVGGLERRYRHDQPGVGAAAYPFFAAVSSADPVTASAAAFGDVTHREAVVHLLALP